MAERPCEHGDFRGWAILRLSVRLQGYVSRQHLWVVRWGVVNLYNFAARSFHTKKLRSRLYSIEIEFYLKTKESIFEPPFCGLRVTRTRTPARWKARDRLPIRHE